MKTAALILSLYILVSCHWQGKTIEHSATNRNNAISDSQEHDTTTITNENALRIDDESMYSQIFIGSLRKNKQLQNIQLADGLMILDQNDTTYFPEIPEIGRSLTFIGMTNEIEISLAIRRINYTSIKYNISMHSEQHPTAQTQGVADIGAYFFLGSESDTDDETQANYFSTEYAHTYDTCYTYIRIGNVEESNKKTLLAKLVKNCNGAMADLDLENCPTLRQE